MIVSVNTFERILKVTASVHDISVEDMLGDTSDGATSHALCMFAQLCRASGYPVVEIAEFVRRPAHSIYTLLGCAKSCAESTPKYKDKLITASKRLNIEDVIFPTKKQKREIPSKQTPKYHPPICKFTEMEELAMRVAIYESCRFMEDYGKGQQPLRPGFATTRQ